VIKRRTFFRLAAGAAAAALAGNRPAFAAGNRQTSEDFSLLFPQDPRLTHFSNSFGAPRSGGRRHQGIDLMAPKLSPVYAAAAGTVERVDDGRLSGRFVVINHGDDHSTWYMHLNNDRPGRDDGRADWSLTLFDGIEAGVEVAAGDQIAYVGDSGNAEGSSSHTHFELHVGGRAVNPYRLLVEAQESSLARLEYLERMERVGVETLSGPR
jgi:murein DD-endopeptidase MepM/ murein hydrolase activator NlpD